MPVEGPCGGQNPHGVLGPRLAEQANIYVSEAKGFFKDEGIDMEFLPGQGSGDALRNVIAGNADIAFGGPEAIYLAADKGSELKAVYDIYPVNVFNVFALKSKQILTPQDLKGKKVGVISMASGTRYDLATILALNGMSERDVELVALGINAAPAIIEGKVDAMASTDSILYGMQAAGLGAVDVIWARDYLTHRQISSLSKQSNWSPEGLDYALPARLQEGPGIHYSKPGRSDRYHLKGRD